MNIRETNRAATPKIESSENFPNAIDRIKTALPSKSPILNFLDKKTGSVSSHAKHTARPVKAPNFLPDAIIRIFGSRVARRNEENAANRTDIQPPPTTDPKYATVDYKAVDLDHTATPPLVGVQFDEATSPTQVQPAPSKPNEYVLLSQLWPKSERTEDYRAQLIEEIRSIEETINQENGGLKISISSPARRHLLALARIATEVKDASNLEELNDLKVRAHSLIGVAKKYLEDKTRGIEDGSFVDHIDENRRKKVLENWKSMPPQRQATYLTEQISKNIGSFRREGGKYKEATHVKELKNQIDKKGAFGDDIVRKLENISGDDQAMERTVKLVIEEIYNKTVDDPAQERALGINFVKDVAIIYNQVPD